MKNEVRHAVTSNLFNRHCDFMPSHIQHLSKEKEMSEERKTWSVIG
jgi:hypothetical protein